MLVVLRISYNECSGENFMEVVEQKDIVMINDSLPAEDGYIYFVKN